MARAGKQRRGVGVPRQGSGRRRRAGVFWVVLGAWACGAALLTERAGAAAWTQRKGAGLLIASFTYDVATRSFDSVGRLTGRERFEKLEANIYAEYGLVDRFTLLLFPGYQRVATGPGPNGARVREYGLNNTGLGGRLRLFAKGAHVVSVEGTYFLPGGLDTTKTTVVSRLNGDTDLRLLYGVGFDLPVFKRRFPAFVDVQAGYRRRAGAPANEVHVDVTFGLRPRSNWQVLLQSFTIVSDGRGAALKEATFPAFRLHKVQVSGVYDVSDRISLQVGGFHALAGRNIIQENAVFGALWVRF